MYIKKFLQHISPPHNTINAKKMCSKELLLIACLFLLGGLRLTSTTTTTTFVAAMSIANQDLERYFRSVNASQTIATLGEERIIIDAYHYAFLSYWYNISGELNVVADDKEKARYGEGKIMNVVGKLVHIRDKMNYEDDTACQPDILGSGGRPTPSAGVTWIALVRRGLCTFEEKVKNVYNKGAKGVIIFNDKQVNNLEKMQIKGQDRNITAVITFLEIGTEMARIVDQGIEMVANITKGDHGTRPINTLNRTSVLFVSISFIVLMVISLVWLLFYYIQRFRYLQTKDQQSRHLCSVTKKAIMKIPTKTGKNTDEKDIDSDCCAICIEAYKPSDCIRVLPCKHEFHKNCIDPWLIEHRTCPMCKLDVLKFYGFVFLGSEESILEYEPDRQQATNGATGAAAPTGNGTQPNGGGGTVTTVAPSALGDLIRSRDFVIDFPRIFVLEAGGLTGTRESLFPARLPERSQSSMSLTHAKDWMAAVANKLDEQHGLRRFRKSSGIRDDMQEHLLQVRVDSVKKRRSRSADGRYTSSFLARKQMSQQQSVEQDVEKASGDAVESEPACGLRYNATLRNLTDASYAQSKQRQRELLALTQTRRRSSVQRSSGADIPLRDLPSAAAMIPRQASVPTRDNSPPNDSSIRIQLNGQGLDLE